MYTVLDEKRKTQYIQHLKNSTRKIGLGRPGNKEMRAGDVPLVVNIELREFKFRKIP